MKEIVCCQGEMKLVTESQRYRQFECEKCHDIVLVKKDDVAKPVMLDD